MSSRYPGRRPGRPLLGKEPLDERLTVMISASMLEKIEARAGGHVAEFVRKVLDKALGGKVGRFRRKVGRGVRGGIHRYEK